MGPEAANLAGSLSKSLDIDRSKNASSRASDVAQEKNTQRFDSGLPPIKAEEADSIHRARLLQQRERKRRQIERETARKHKNTQRPDDDGLDVMV
ncbi:MAG: hypothetical protein ACOX3G_08780 [Armatimonadota bacterium]|jgi:hypothetical protein